MVEFVELISVYWEYCRNPADVTTKRAEAVGGIVRLLSEKAVPDVIPSLVEGLLKTSLQASAALQRRGTTEFLLDLFNSLDQAFCTKAINANPAAFTDFVGILSLQASDWHSAATALIPLLILLLRDYAEPLQTIRASPPAWILNPAKESMSYRTRPVDKPEAPEPEMIDFSQPVTSRKPIDAPKSCDTDMSSDSFLTADVETIPLSIYLVSAPLVFIFGPNFADSIRSSVYEHLEISLKLYASDIGQCIGPRFVSESLYQMVDEQRLDALLTCFRYIKQLRQSLPQCFIEENSLPAVPKIPLTKGCASSASSSGGLPGTERLQGPSVGPATQWHHGELYASFLTAYISVLGRLMSHSDTEASAKTTLLIAFADACLAWRERLLPALFEKSLDELASTGNSVGEKIASDSITRLLLYVIHHTDSSVLRYLLIPVIELAKILLWTNQRADGTEDRLQSLITAVCMRALKSANCCWLKSSTGFILLDSLGEDFSECRAEERDIYGPYEDLVATISNLRSLLLPQKAPQATFPHANSTPFIASSWLLRTISGSSLAGAATAWSYFRDPLLEAIGRDSRNTLQGGLTAATTRLELITDIVGYIFRYSCRWLPVIADRKHFCEWLKCLVGSDRVRNGIMCLKVEEGPDDRVRDPLRRLETLLLAIDHLCGTEDLVKVISELMTKDVGVASFIAGAHDLSATRAWLKSLLRDRPLDLEVRQALLAQTRLLEPILAAVLEECEVSKEVPTATECRIFSLLSLGVEAAVLAAEAGTRSTIFPPTDGLSISLSTWHKLCVHHTELNERSTSFVDSYADRLGRCLALTNDEKALTPLLTRLCQAEPETCVNVARANLLESKSVKSLDLFPPNVIARALEDTSIADLLLHRESLQRLMTRGPSLSPSVFLGLLQRCKGEIPAFAATLVSQSSELEGYQVLRILMLVAIWADDSRKAAEEFSASMTIDLRMKLLTLLIKGTYVFPVAGDSPAKLLGDEEAKAIENLGDSKEVLREVLCSDCEEAVRTRSVELEQALWLLRKSSNSFPIGILESGTNCDLRLMMYAEALKQPLDAPGALKLVRQLARWSGVTELTDFQLLVVARLMCQGLNTASGAERPLDEKERLEQLEKVLVPAVSKLCTASKLFVGAPMRAVRGLGSLYSVACHTLDSELKSEAQSLSRRVTTYVE